jgi:hypothetical protein
MAFEQCTRGLITDEQFLEESTLEAKHTNENRAKARDDHRLVDKPGDFDSDLKGEEAFERGCRRVKGYSPEDRKGEPLLTAYQCGYCKGWIQGEPFHEDINTMVGMGGSKGAVYSCKICDHEVGHITLVHS